MTVLGFVIPVAPLVEGIGLSDIIVGLAITLATLAGWVFLGLMGSATSHIPVIGGPVSSVLDTMSHWWKRKTLDLIKGSIHKVTLLANAAWSVVSLVWQFMFVVVGITVTLVRHLDIVAQNSNAGVAQLRAQEQADVQTIDAYIENAQNEITLNKIFATTYTDERVANVRALEDLKIATLTTTEANDKAGLTAQLNANVNTLNNRITQVNTGLINRINTDVSTINTTVRNDVNSLTAADATNLRTAENFATGLVSGLGIGALRSTITALQSQVSKIATETTECLDPLCDTVTPQAQRLGRNAKNWQNLEDLGIAAILVAMGAELLTNPGPVVSDIGTVVNDVGQPLVSAARDLIGA